MAEAKVLHVDRPSLASITGVHTQLLKLSPAFLAALRGVAPKKRRPTYLYVVVAAVLAFVIVVVASGAARELLLSL